MDIPAADTSAANVRIHVNRHICFSSLFSDVRSARCPYAGPRLYGRNEARRSITTPARIEPCEREGATHLNRATYVPGVELSISGVSFANIPSDRKTLP